MSKVLDLRLRKEHELTTEDATTRISATSPWRGAVSAVADPDCSDRQDPVCAPRPHIQLLCFLLFNCLSNCLSNLLSN